MKCPRTHNSCIAILSLALVLLLGSCGKNRETVYIAGPASPNYVTENMEANMLDYEWFSAKVATEVLVNDQKKSFKTK